MVLSDKTIKKLAAEKNLIEPFNLENLSSNSYDLTIGDQQYDLKLLPGEAKLIVTKETLSLPNNVVAKTVSKSSFARCGVSIGDIGGWVDAGYKGQLTLLAVNLGDSIFDLSNFDKFTQIVFFQSDAEADKPYDGHYQNSKGLRQAWFKNNINTEIPNDVDSRLVDPEFFNKRWDF